MASVTASLVLGFAVSANADSWGSWGGSHGSVGNGGSFGSSGGFASSGSVGGSGGSGLFGGRRPIRNFFGRISDRIHGRHGSNGSVGGSSGGSTGFVYASNGSHGSMGSSFGSVGASYGSTGFGYGSVGMSHAVSYGTPVWGNSMSHSPVIYDSGYPNGGTIIDQGTPANSGGSDFRPVDGINFEGNGQNFPNPRPEADGSTGIVNPSTTVLNLKLPADAKVYINDKLTRTPGENRRYIARNLEPNADYYYNVKAVVVRDGVERVRSEVVGITAGSLKTVEINFDQAVTSVAINVPEDAQVKLCGKLTSAAGAQRVFSTDKLEEGQQWSDYTIEVLLERNGRVIREEKRIDIVGGQTYQFDFEFDPASEMLAVK